MTTAERPPWAKFLDDYPAEDVAPDIVDPHPELMNPFVGYWVYSHNPEFNEEIAGYLFINGRCRLDPVAKDDPAKVVHDRFALLEFFQNAHLSDEVHEVWNPKRRVMEQVSTTRAPTYRVVPFPENGPAPDPRYDRRRTNTVVKTQRAPEPSQAGNRSYQLPPEPPVDDDDDEEGGEPDPEQYADLLNTPPKTGKAPQAARKL